MTNGWTLPLADRVESVAEQIAAGGLGAASRDELQPVLEELLRSWWFPVRASRGVLESDVHRSSNRVLDWLEAQGPGTWQERWDRTDANRLEIRWSSLIDGVGPGARGEVGYALDGLIVLRVIAPGHGWFLGAKRSRLWREWVRYHDVERYQELSKLVAAETNRRVQLHVVNDLIRISAVTGKSLVDITRTDFLTARAVNDATGRRHRTLHGAWHFARLVRLLDGEPPELTMVTSTGQLGPAQLVDRYPVHNLRMRTLLINYLSERATTCDYATLESVSRHLSKYFWGDLQQHHPDLDTLALTPEQAKAWQERLATLPNGRSRRDLYTIIGSVRTLYTDLSVWSHEDPARWIEYVAPCPFAFRPTARARRIHRQHQEADMHNRTRALAPQLPRLVASITADLVRAERILTLAAATQRGASFDVDGQSWTRRPQRQHVYDSNAVLVIDPFGAAVDVTSWEERAFWTWASTEVLRHSGVRIEELIELTHLSVRPFRKPTGEIVPLLQVAPSKTDQERVIPASPALAHALGRVIARHLGHSPTGSIPLSRRRDEHELTFSTPMPFLFQRTHGNGRRQVMGSAQFRNYLKAASAKAGLKDNDGRPVHITPHDFRRLYATDLVSNGLPIHIAAALLGHRDLRTTQGYNAIYPTDVITHYDAFITRRRQERPSDEYRQPTPDELREFAEHFGRRRVELGDCVRPYASSCSHEHACIRCHFLQTAPAARDRLDEIESDLETRLNAAKEHQWIGDVEQLKVTLERLRAKRDDLPAPPGLGTPTPASLLTVTPLTLDDLHSSSPGRKAMP